MLLIPALLIIGFQAITSTEISEENAQASTYFQMPALKSLINTFCSH
jgi:hypothetical protein